MLQSQTTDQPMAHDGGKKKTTTKLNKCNQLFFHVIKDIKNHSTNEGPNKNLIVAVERAIRRP